MGIPNACLWLKADDGGLIPGSTVSTWQDRSDNQKDMTGVGNPSVVAGSDTEGMNFNPVVRFNGTNQELKRNESTIGADVSEINVFFVSRGERQASGMSKKRQTSGMFYHATPESPRAQAQWPYDDHLYWDISNRETLNRNTSFVSFAPDVANLGLVTNSERSDTMEIVVNARTATTRPGRGERDASLNITVVGGGLGNWYQHFYSWYNGDIPEFLEFKRHLDAPQRTRVQSYLALKYGLTLDRNGLENKAYTSGSGTSVYSYSDYWNSIIGIGRDSVTKLDQRVSRSTQKIGSGNLWVQQGDSPLTIATTPDFTSANNDSRRTPLTNGQYLVLGDNNGDVATLGSATAEQFGRRIGRVWRAQNTGGVGPVYLGFDPTLLETNFPADKRGFLLVSTDADFSVANTTRYALGRVTVGSKAVFTPVADIGQTEPLAITIPDGSYITLGQESVCTGTALGIADACLWLKANDGAGAPGSSVGIWQDRSGSQKNMTGVGSPSVVAGSNTAGMNFNPVVRFNGVDQSMWRNESTIGTDVSEANIFFAMRETVRQGPVARTLLSHFTWPFPVSGFQWLIHWPRGYDDKLVWDRGLWDEPRHRNRSSAPFAVGVSNLGLVTNSVSSDTATIVVNAKTLTDEMPPSPGIRRTTTDLSNTRIGTSRLGSAEAHLHGDIAELLEFKRDLTPTERTRVQSYLALKYGLTLDRDGLDRGELKDKAYTSGGDKAVYSDSNHWNSIIGLGRDGVTGLDQRVSRSMQKIGTGDLWVVPGDSPLTIATTPDFTSANGNHRRKIFSGQYLVLGDNNGALDALSADALGQRGNRIPRVWLAQNTLPRISGEIITAVYLGFDPAPLPASLATEGYLLVSSDANFSAATTARYPLNLVNLGGKVFLTPVVEEGSSTPGAVVMLPGASYISLGQSSAQLCTGSAMGIADACAWYRADRGLDDNRNWPDQSGAGNSAIVNGSPSLTPNSVNFNATVDYRGGAGHTLPATADVINRYTFLGLARMVGTHNGRVFSDRFNNRIFGYWGGPRPKQDVWTDVPGYLTEGNFGNYDVYVFRRTEVVPQTRPMLYTLRHNDDDAASFKSNGRTLIDTRVGATSKYRVALANGGTYFEQADDYADVSIPEFFSFKRALSDAEIDRIESYLALKYGFTLGSAAEPKNYVNSENQAVWTANRAYQHRVFGLGRDSHATPNNSTTLDQRVSKSTDHTLDDTRSSILTIATSADFTSANGGTRRQLEPGQYLVLGDNDGALTALSASAMGRNNNRLPRVWRAQTTGVGSVFLGLDDAATLRVFDSRYPRYLFVESGAGADGSFPADRTHAYALSNTLTDLTGYWVPVAVGVPLAVNIPNDGAYLSYGTLTEPQLSLTVQSRGGTGTFGFSGDNGSIASSAITRAEMQPVAASPATQTLSAPDVDIVITVAMPAAGWRLEAASCIDRRAAISGNPSGAVLGGVSASDKFTIPAAQAKASADLHCALIARYDSGSTLKTVSGRVFVDNGVGGGVANDGHINGAETGRSGAALSLTNCGSGSTTIYAYTSSSGDGRYSLKVPPTVTNGPMCIAQTLIDDYRVTQGGLEASGLDATRVNVTLDTDSAQSNRWRFTYAGASVQNLHIGNVPSSRLLVDGTRVGIAGSTVDFPHRLIAGTAGTLAFEMSDASPAASGWSEVLYRDANCNAQLDAGEPLLGGNPTAVAADAPVCVIVRQFVPAGLYEGATRQFQLQATLNWANAASRSETLTNRDHTQVSGQALRLYKEVRNVTADERSGTGRESWTTSNSAKPGETLEYRTTFTNLAPEPITKLEIYDATPNYTTLVSAECPAALSLPAGLTCEPLSSAASPPTKPIDGGTGPLRWHFTGPLSGGASGAVKYRVKVNE